VAGSALAVTDLDGDGWADLLVRHGWAEGYIVRNTGDGSFVDVRESSGLMVGRLGGLLRGSIMITGDVDNDGDLDVFSASERGDPSDANAETSELMLNNGDGTFSFGPSDSAARMADVPSRPNGATFVDFDRDGNLDLWTVHYEQGDMLFRGDGAGGFVDVTQGRGLATSEWNDFDQLNQARAHTAGWGSGACDLNNDNIPELMATSYGRMPNHLWRGGIHGDGTTGYVNESVASGYAFDHRADWTTNLSARCYCQDNPAAAECNTCPEPTGSPTCAELAAAFGPGYRWDHNFSREPFQLGGNSGSTMCADVNNDGWFDLLTTEIVHFDVGDNSDPSEIMVNLGHPEVRFDRPGNEATGLVRVDNVADWNHGDMTGAVFDFDNDGWQDIYIGASDYEDNRGQLFHQYAPLKFERVDVDDSFLHYRSYGTAVADFDRDGDLDIVVGHSHMRCDDDDPGNDECYETTQVRMFENLMGDGSNWLQLELSGGEGSNQMAIGARVQVTAGEVTQTQQIDGGHGRFAQQHDRVAHFGLGDECRATVRITWPDADATVQTFEVDGNQRYLVAQGEEPVEDG
jgi:hypothetical protein